MSSATQGQQTARFFTSARRITVLFGKLPNGGRLWGGPYTLVQVIIGSMVLIIGWTSRPVWGPAVGGSLSQIIYLGAAAAAATYISGRIPSTRRRIPNLLMDTVAAVTVPGTGSHKGTTIKLPPPHYVKGTVLLDFDNDTITAIEEKARKTAIESPPRIHAVPALPKPELPDNVIPLVQPTYATGLERLLDQARRKESN